MGGFLKIGNAANGTPGCQLNGDVPSLGCLAEIMVNVIQALLLFLGAAVLFLLLFGAIQFILARGDQKALQKAQGTITYAILGAVFIMGSFIIISVIANALNIPDVLRTFTFYQ